MLVETGGEITLRDVSFHSLPLLLPPRSLPSREAGGRGGGGGGEGEGSSSFLVPWSMTALGLMDEDHPHMLHVTGPATLQDTTSTTRRKSTTMVVDDVGSRTLPPWWYRWRIFYAGTYRWYVARRRRGRRRRRPLRFHLPLPLPLLPLLPFPLPLPLLLRRDELWCTSRQGRVSTWTGTRISDLRDAFGWTQLGEEARLRLRLRRHRMRMRRRKCFPSGIR